MVPTVVATMDRSENVRPEHRQNAEAAAKLVKSSLGDPRSKTSWSDLTQAFEVS